MISLESATLQIDPIFFNFPSGVPGYNTLLRAGKTHDVKDLLGPEDICLKFRVQTKSHDLVSPFIPFVADGVARQEVLALRSVLDEEHAFVRRMERTRGIPVLLTSMIDPTTCAYPMRISEQEEGLRVHARRQVAVKHLMLTETANYVTSAFRTLSAWDIGLRLSEYFVLFRGAVWRSDIPLKEEDWLSEIAEWAEIQNVRAEWRQAQEGCITAPMLEIRRRMPIPSSIRHEVWRRDEGRCCRCGSREKLEYDHIVPLARGGSSSVRNLELLCEACNRSKGATLGRD